MSINLEQKDNYVASDKIKPEVFNQIGRNIKLLAEEMNNQIIVSDIQIEPSYWENNEYIYELQGISENDLPIIWFEDVELAADCEVQAETITNGIKFTCESIPDDTMKLSLEVKKVESQD